MSDDEYPSALANDPNESTPGKHKGPRFSWNPTYEATFFQSLVESVDMGLKDGTVFKGEAWQRALDALRTRHNAEALKSHLINKSDNARKKFRLWRGLRENPHFVYNPQARTVAGSEEAWNAHIQKEPLSRALKGRPFEHEHLYERLFPDVIGSRGAAKRVTKQQRRKTDMSNEDLDANAQNTDMLGLLEVPTYNPVVQGMGNPNLNNINNNAQPPPPQAATHTLVSNVLPSQVQLAPHTAQQQSRSMQHPRNSLASTSALTPPEETLAQHNQAMVQQGGQSSQQQQQQATRKRFAPSDGNAAGTSNSLAATTASPNKRQRTSTTAVPPSVSDSFSVGTTAQFNTVSLTGSTSGPALLPSTNTAPVASTAAGTASASMSANLPASSMSLVNGIVGLADVLRVQRTPSWKEQAVELFFREFGDEDVDLQIKIAEKVLGVDEDRAMVFMKMSTELRKRWVARARGASARIT
jgi:hypothetical protein